MADSNCNMVDWREGKWPYGGTPSDSFWDVSAVKRSPKFRNLVLRRLLPTGVPISTIDDVILSKDMALGAEKRQVVCDAIERDFQEPWPVFINIEWEIDLAGKHLVPFYFVQWAFSEFLKARRDTPNSILQTMSV